MTEQVPTWRFVESAGGSGPLLTFQRPNSASGRGLREEVVFQKGLHGASWFRVNLTPVVEGPAAMGTMRHVLWEGETLGPDVRWKEDIELVEQLRCACSDLERRARAFFRPFEAPRCTALFSGLVDQYLAWFSSDGVVLPLDAFAEDDEGGVHTFESFSRWLDRRRLTRGLPFDVRTPLRRFWNEGRPMRRDDYDPGDFYGCSRCGSFIRPARGRLVAHRLAGFGRHFTLVCSRH